jgi:tripartite-type tricarboxylate transporter receptor subunit TctC
MVTVKAGTDQAKINVLATALEKVVKDPEYVAYLQEQYADPNSYVPSANAQRFLKGELESMKALAGTK